jgi:hypothetical protein
MSDTPKRGIEMILAMMILTIGVITSFHGCEINALKSREPTCPCHKSPCTWMSKDEFLNRWNQPGDSGWIAEQPQAK